MSETIAAGGLEFLVENRVAGEGKDGGPTLRVRATVDGASVQLLRFDMFRIEPHYHYAPGSAAAQRYDLDPLTIDDGISWVIGLVSRKLPELLAKAGHASLATPATVSAVVKSLPDIERRWRKLN